MCSIRYLIEKYNKRYFKNKIDLTVVAYWVPHDNLFKTNMSFVIPVKIINKKKNISSLSNANNFIFNKSLLNIKIEDKINKIIFMFITMLPAIKLKGIKAKHRLK